MKILLVDNNTTHLASLVQALAGHQVEVQPYHPEINFHYQDKDLVILSGGGGQNSEIHDIHASGRLWYEKEMEFILKCNKPIIGICMGFEVIASAYGQKVTEMPALVRGLQTIRPVGKGKLLISRKPFQQFESHTWNVESIPAKDFEVLAESEHGIEIIRHKRKPIIATQFHPELGGSLQLRQLVNL